MVAPWSIGVWELSSRMPRLRTLDGEYHSSPRRTVLLTVVPQFPLIELGERYIGVGLLGGAQPGPLGRPRVRARKARHVGRERQALDCGGAAGGDEGGGLGAQTDLLPRCHPTNLPLPRLKRGGKRGGGINKVERGTGPPPRDVAPA